MIIFGRSVTEKVRNQTVLCFPNSPTYCFSITLQKRNPRRQRTGALCVPHSPISAALSTSFLLNHAPNSLKLKVLITIFRELYSSARMSHESKRLKKSSSNRLNSGNALIQHMKNAIFVFPVLPGSAEPQVIWGGIVKCLLIAYFVCNISAKKYQNPFACVKVIANQRPDVFQTRCIIRKAK